MRDPRDRILAKAHEQNSKFCETLGHHFIPDFALNGDYACGYCRQVRALSPEREIDKTLERMSADGG